MRVGGSTTEEVGVAVGPIVDVGAGVQLGLGVEVGPVISVGVGVAGTKVGRIVGGMTSQGRVTPTRSE